MLLFAVGVVVGVIGANVVAVVVGVVVVGVVVGGGVVADFAVVVVGCGWC